MKKVFTKKALYIALPIIAVLALVIALVLWPSKPPAAPDVPTTTTTATSGSTASTEQSQESSTDTTTAPTTAATATPTETPTNVPTVAPTSALTTEPTEATTAAPNETSTKATTAAPTKAPIQVHTVATTKATANKVPSAEPTTAATKAPTTAPTAAPTEKATTAPTKTPATTNTTATKPHSGPVITQQPTDSAVKLGETYRVSVKAEGKGLKYQWYFRSPGVAEFTKSSVTTSVYTNVLTEQRANREVYCVITDADGNSVTTNTVKLVLVEEKLETLYDYWTQTVTLSAGTHPKYGGSSTGYYNKGQTFDGILYSSTFREGTDAIWNLNYSTYYSAIANPASLLYTVDYRGRVHNEAAWAGSVCSSTALRACGYIYPFSTSAIASAFQEKPDRSIDVLEVGDILWRSGHCAGVVGVTKDADGHVTSVKIIEQASYVKVFDIADWNWTYYFSTNWTNIYRGEQYMRETPEIPVIYPENMSIIFERGNNTYVTDYAQMLFYIPTADTVYLTKDGKTTSYATSSFPTKVVNNTTVYDLASLFTGVGDYYFHTNENTTDICIKVISTGTITIDPVNKTATLSGYSNCTPHGFCIVRITKKTSASEYDFLSAPEGYIANTSTLTFRQLEGDTFAIENIPENIAGWKLEIYFDTGFGWARALSENIMY